MTDPASGIAHVVPLDVSISVADGETLFEAASRQGYAWPTRCFGQAQCTLCAVEVESGGEHVIAPEAEEQALLQRIAMMRGPGSYRLACRLRLCGQVTVRKAGVVKGGNA